MTSKKTTTISVRVDCNLRRQLDLIASKRGILLGDLVKTILRENLAGISFEQAQSDLDKLEKSATNVDILIKQMTILQERILKKTERHSDETLVKLESLKKTFCSIENRYRWERFLTLIVCGMFLFIMGFTGLLAAHFILGI